MVSVAGKQISPGSPLTGKCVTLRIDTQLVHGIADGGLTGTGPLSLPNNTGAYTAPGCPARSLGRLHK
jgi:hypothetical protein